MLSIQLLNVLREREGENGKADGKSRDCSQFSPNIIPNVNCTHCSTLGELKAQVVKLLLGSNGGLDALPSVV